MQKNKSANSKKKSISLFLVLAKMKGTSVILFSILFSFFFSENVSGSPTAFMKFYEKDNNAEIVIANTNDTHPILILETVINYNSSYFYRTMNNALNEIVVDGVQCKDSMSIILELYNHFGKQKYPYWDAGLEFSIVFIEYTGSVELVKQCFGRVNLIFRYRQVYTFKQDKFFTIQLT
jgi:hypothetical protein